MACKLHPNYGGIRKPRTDCKSCWEFYNAKKKSIEIQETSSEKSPQETTETSFKVEKTLSCSGDCSCSSTKEHSEEIGQVREANKLRLEDEINTYIETLLKQKLVEAKSLIYKELSIEYEHLFIEDGVHGFELSKRLTDEGWEWVHHTYPLAKNGILAKDYVLFKRLKRDSNLPVPDFGNPKTLKKYNAKIKGK